MEDLSKYVPQILEYVFKGVIAAAIWHLRNINKSADKLNQSVLDLNKNVAIMFERHDTKEKQIEALMSDVRTLRDRSHEMTNEFAPRVLINEERIRQLDERTKKFSLYHGDL